MWLCVYCKMLGVVVLLYCFILVVVIIVGWYWLGWW